MAIKGYWKLNGNSNDYSGNGNNGTDTNITYSQGNGKLGQAAAFNGTTSEINCGTSSTLQISGAGTVSCWFNLTAFSTSSTWYYISQLICKGLQVTGSQLCFDLSIRAGASKSLYFGTYSSALGDKAAVYSFTSEISTGNWYHVCGTYDGVTIKLYLNSKLVASTLFSGVFQTSSAPTCIGRFYNSAGLNDKRLFNGKIDEVIIDNTAWSPAQIKNEYARVLGFF